ncbi:MAG: hypothetical protein F4138_06335 [Acidimicrobiia bacterium]|nr:hypothetical protein [Acidimicrobiia bacterium]
MSVATVINHKGWVFEGVHNSYTVALVSVTRCFPLPHASTPSSGPSTGSMAATPSPSFQLANSVSGPIPGGGFEGDPDEPYVAIYPGPASSFVHFRELVDGKPEHIPVSEFIRWSNTAAFPQIPNRPAFRVWRKMKQHPRFDGADLPDSSDDLSLSLSLGEPEVGGSDQSKAMSIQQTTGDDSSETMGMGLPSSFRTPLDSRQVQICERRWHFRPSRELDSTNDRSRFLKDDGHAAVRYEQ